MSHTPWNRRFAASTRGRIAELLRAKPRTIDDMGRTLGLTSNAVRAHVLTLVSDGLVERAGQRSTASKPSALYRMTAGAEAQYSRLYLPFVSQLFATLGEQLSPARFDALMRKVGRSLLPAARQTAKRGTLAERARACTQLLNDFGGSAHVERIGGRIRIRSQGCPLALVTEQHVEACHAVESLLHEFSGLSVTTCCERNGVSRCCFELSTARR